MPKVTLERVDCFEWEQTSSSETYQRPCKTISNNKKLDKYSLNTEKISDCFDSDSHDDSFMLYGSCAKTYNAKKEDLSPEIVSLSTEYDPNSTSR